MLVVVLDVVLLDVGAVTQVHGSSAMAPVQICPGGQLPRHAG